MMIMNASLGEVSVFRKNGIVNSFVDGFNRTKMIDGEGGVTNYVYNSRNLLEKLTNPSGKLFNFTYDAKGRREGLGYPNGIATTYAYDAVDQVTDILSKLNNDTVAKNIYTYDPAGNRRTNTDLQGQHTYEYDSTYQLRQAAHPNLVEAYTYDKNGNRLTETRNAATVNYASTAGNRIQTRGTTTYVHDNNGNITSKTDGTAVTLYEYDHANRLKKVTMPDGSTAEYKYDALWRRIEKTVTMGSATTITRYIYDGFDILAEYDENNAIKTRYTFNIGIDDPIAMERSGQSHYYHKDALGTITKLTDSAGNVVQSYEYDAYGKITHRLNASFEQPFTFTGREYDSETGLYYYRMRYYDSEIGRFISEDPIGFAGGINKFAYVVNNPENWVDPLGLWRNPWRIYNEANDKAILIGLPGMHNGKQDAYRHCLASCMMTKEIGVLSAQLFGWANEKRGDWSHNQECGERAMDDFNNQKGRDIGLLTNSNSDCSTQCLNAANRGYLQTYTSGTTSGYWY
ncbi:MAG: RHS repeat domain-containing protein [Thermodesulfovibrionales bacterium]